MARTVEIPSFEFSAFYYPQILDALIRRKRIDVPELTDESDFEPFIQLLRSFALVGHLNNVLVDLVANESTLPTASLPETVRNMLRLIDYELSAASPAATDLVYELGKVFVTGFDLVSDDAQVATRKTATAPAIFFEALGGPLTIERTDEFKAVKSDLAGLFSDHTADANGAVNFTPWVGGPASKDALYFGHASVMWDTLNVDVDTALTGITGIWEFYDGDFRDIQPTSVTNIGGGNLEIDLTSLLGTSNRQGTTIRVTVNETGASETVESTWTGLVNIATVGLIGQTTPSEVADDYTIGSDWTEFAQAGLDFTDGTTGLTVDGDVAYVLPQTELRNWIKTTVDGDEAFWVRFRVIEVSGPTSPILNLCRLDTGKQYALSLVTQGKSVADDPLGSSTGVPNQIFETSRDNFIDNSQELTVDAEVWISVENFLSSTPQDKHYVVELGENDRASFKFGDGIAGRIPPVGVGNIASTYRFNAELDGNVGANTIVVDKTGLTFVNDVFNPRQAGGWAEAEGASETSLERAKIAGPASLRVKEVALNGDDAVVLAVAFTDSGGTKPFSRGVPIEEGFGPKTVELVLVGSGGVQPTQTQLDELKLYFNGDKFAIPPLPKRFVANQEVIPVSFDPKVIDVTAVVETAKGVTAAQIVNRLSQIVQPEALKEDGVSFEWNFGGDVPISRLGHEIFKTDDRIEDVDISVPAIDVPLSATELPVIGTVSIVIIEL